MDNSKGRQAINSWGIFLIDDIKSPQRNSIAMGPFGSNIKKENFQAEGIPVIRGNNLKNSKFVDCNFVYISDKLANQLSASLARRLDIILTHRGTIGQVAIIPPNSKFNTYIVSQSQMKLTLDQTKCDPYFVYYFLRSEFGISQFLSNSSQTGVPAIASPTTALKSIKIPLPPLNKQKAIAKILFDLDSKTELNQKMNKTLEAIAQAIFKHWFIDFEFPNEEGKPYKSSGGEMVDSERGEVPKGWKASTIGKELKTVLGGTPSTENKDYWSNASIPWINSGKINEFRIIFPSAYITVEGLKHSATKLMPKGTTVLAITGATLGKVSIIEREMCANQSVVGVLGSEKLPSEYIYFWIKNNINRLVSNQTGGAQQHINKGNIDEIEILVPDSHIMEHYVKTIRPIFDKISSSSFEEHNLSKIRDIVLPKLMTGKIRVPLEE